MARAHMTVCPLCQADPQPGGFGSPRQCAFTRGVFDAENWNCATLNALVDHPDVVRVEGADESMHIVRGVVADEDFYHDGWFVLTRYKHRGRVSSLVRVGDFYPPRVAVTLAEVQTVLQRREAA